MDNKQMWTTVIIAFVVAVIASVITAQITGNVITVKESPTGQKVYTIREVDDKLNSVSTRVYTKSEIDNLLSRANTGVVFHTLEGESVKIGDYAVLDSPIRTRILKSTAIDNLAANAKVSFVDALVGEKISVTVGGRGEASTTIDGQTYYLKVYNESIGNSVMITWGGGAAPGNVGTEVTAYLGTKTTLKN